MRKVALVVAFAVASAVGSAGAAEAPITVGEISAPAATGVDRTLLRTAAEGEITRLDTRGMPERPVVVSLAVVRATASPPSCTVNAMIRDRRTGAIVAIVEGRARSEAQGSDARRRVASAAVGYAVRQIPEALATKE